jgi:uridine phosphorylase
VATRLRPTAPIAPAAVLVGDPGRALLLAQELLEQPKMSNHARGLWGYGGRARESGIELTIQSTGIGGPSAALVLAELAELGVRRAVRVGSCAASSADLGPGTLILVERAIAEGGSASAFGLGAGDTVLPDRELTAGLGRALGPEARESTVASFDTPPGGAEGGAPGAADMQTAALLARAKTLGVAAAATLVVVEEAGEPPLADELREEAERRAGRAAAEALSDPKVEG